MGRLEVVGLLILMSQFDRRSHPHYSEWHSVKRLWKNSGMKNCESFYLLTRRDEEG